jgi:hypothetical protein
VSERERERERERKRELHMLEFSHASTHGRVDECVLEVCVYVCV